MPKVNKSFVESASTPEKDAFFWDDEIKGFGLKVSPSGSKAFVFQYRTKQGRSRRFTIGRYSDTLTADQARKRAKDLRRAVEDGGDPMNEKQVNRQAETLEEVFDRYLASAKFAEKADSTKATDRGRINRHLKPTIGRLYADDLTAEDVRKAFNHIRDGKTATNQKTGFRGRAIVRGGEGAARMSVRLLRAVLTWEGYTGERNPANSVNVGSDGERDTVLETGEEYARLFETLTTMENEKRIRPAHADAIRIIALTGARRGEIASLQWRHVDQKKALITLPPSQHKTGKKTGKPRIIGLPTAAVEIIARQPAGDPDDFVFIPSKGSGGAVTLSATWRKVRVEAKLPDGIGLHGLRHSLASHMAINGAQAAEIMTALGHRQLSTAQRYIHWAEDARKGLAERSAAHITAAMNAKPAPKTKPKLKVVK
jgi:integrase